MHRRVNERKEAVVIYKQHQLPPLPIPPLNHTRDQLIQWLKPLLSREQWRKTTYVINRFFQPNGVAEKLQQKLYEWKKSSSGSWLAPFRDDLYLKNRDSLPLSTNFNILLENEAYKHRYTMVEFAGIISYLVAKLYHKIIDGKVKQNTLHVKPLNIDQYKYFFLSVRIPQRRRDAIYVSPFDKKNNYIVLLYKNYIYKVPVTRKDGTIYQSSDIIAAIRSAIWQERHEGINVNIFTAAKRDKAEKVYRLLNRSKVNQRILQTIARALVVISLDEESESSEEAIKHLMLHPNNKYFDKTIQIVITKYGHIGFNIEHATVDGTAINTVIRYISNGLSNHTLLDNHSFEKIHVEKMTWELTKNLKETLYRIQANYLSRIKNYHLLSKIFTDFGATCIKQMNISPDAFFHIALQLAKYRTYGQFKSVYEPVNVRFFRGGRTECARATSMEKRRLVEAIEDGNVSTRDLYEMMQKASCAHRRRIQQCQKGYGIERHLLGLEQMYYLFGNELGIQKLPEIFTDEGYLALRHDFLSTSGTVYKDAKYRMFAPVVSDGHGIAYFLLDDVISINISSFTHNQDEGKQLMKHLFKALKELKTIALSG